MRPLRDRALKWIVVTTLLGLLGGLAAVLLLASEPPARAQRTGGSFGGGSFGGGGSRGGGGYSGGGGYGGYRGGSGVYYGSSRGLGGCGAPGCCTLFVVLGVFVALHYARRGNVMGSMHTNVMPYGHVPPAHNRIDVSALIIGLDARARPFVQKRLDELARSGNTSSSGGLATLLHETITMLRRSELAWTYIGVLSTLPRSPSEAESLFRTTAGDMRSRFKEELVRRGDMGVVSAATPEMRALAHEGAGFVVVTLLIAAHREIPDVAVPTDPREIDRLVQSIGAMSASDLAALEVIWSPAAENDRMSSAELETLYPELRRMPGADAVGKVFCSYCSGPFARELPRCPHCGAPSAESSRT